MTCTRSQNVALARIIARLAATMAEFFAIILQFILAIVENAGNGLRELDAFCRKTGRGLMALQRALSHPMMPKLGFLLPSASALDALACKLLPEFKGGKGKAKGKGKGNRE